MRLAMTPALFSRRGIGAGFALAATGYARAQSAAGVPTPRQITGPFYPVDWTEDADADLVRVHGAEAEALGVVAHLRGRVLDVGGEPVSGAAIEIWQCDSNGLYRHPNDRPGARDANFQGRGRMASGPDGGFAFRTIRPVPYPGRTPHIHVLVTAPGRPSPLVTQLYIAGEPQNERDRQFNAVREPREREMLLMRFQPADRIESGSLLAERDIVLG